MHAVVPPRASALCVFFFGTQHGRNTWVHYLAAHRTATHRRVRPSMVVVWALLDVSRHFIVRPLTLASPRPGPAHQSARPEIRWSRKPRLPFRSHGQQRHNGLPYYSTECDDENSKFRSPSPAKDSCTNAGVKQGVTRVSYSPRVRTQMWACCSQCSPNFKRGRSTSPGPYCQTGAHPPVYCRPRPSGASLKLPARRYALASFFVMFRCPGQGRGDDTVRLPHHHRGTPPRDGFKRPDLGQCHPKSVAGASKQRCS